MPLNNSTARAAGPAEGDELVISLSEGPVQNTRSKIDVTTFPELAKRFATPEIGPKNGAYILRGPCFGRRADENLHQANLVVFDADKSIDTKTGELIGHAPNPAEVSELLTDLGVAHILFSTHSHRSEAPRWRLLMPVSRPYKLSECEPVTNALFSAIKRTGVAPSHESGTWSQAFFTPRVASSDAPFEFYALPHGRPFSVNRAVHWAFEHELCNLELEEKQRMRNRSVSGRPSAQSMAAIFEFNRAHDIEEFLSGAGYARCRGSRRISGAVASCWRHPGSQSGEPGVFVFYSETKAKQLLIAHSTSDPLYGHRYLDAYDVAQVLGVAS